MTISCCNVVSADGLSVTSLKRCSICRTEKSRTDDFYWSKGHPKGECKSCTKNRATERQRVYGRYPVPLVTRKRRYLREKSRGFDGRTEASFFQKFRRHGLTLDQYHALAERQDFLCAICGEEPLPQNNRKGNVDNFVIEHDHLTNRVRSLSCWGCNAGLGHFRDNPEILRKATLYLETHHARR